MCSWSILSKSAFSLGGSVAPSACAFVPLHGEGESGTGGVTAGVRWVARVATLQIGGGAVVLGASVGAGGLTVG